LLRCSEVAICVLLSAGAAFSQTDRGSITGAITDPSNAAVPGAMIEVKSQTTGAIYHGGASVTGNYVVTGLPAGDYTLSVTAPGFKKFARENITVEVATDSRVDARLEIGPAAEAVVISESEPLLKTESGELSHTVAGELAGRLPLLTIGTTQGFGSIRNPLQVVNLLSGALFSPDSILRVNGLPSNSQAIRIEGQDSTNGIWRQIDSLTQAGMDAVQEVAIQTSNAAEFGQAAGGYFNFTMKSGANRFHGVAYDYFVNEAFNAGLPYTNAGKTNSLKQGEHIRARQRRNDFGFTIGGPIDLPRVYDGRNRSFFFFNFEQFREIHGIGNAVYTVPTAAYRQGDFATAVPVCAT